MKKIVTDAVQNVQPEVMPSFLSHQVKHGPGTCTPVLNTEKDYVVVRC
jgi:hypothetical protein